MIQLPLTNFKRQRNWLRKKCSLWCTTIQLAIQSARQPRKLDRLVKLSSLATTSWVTIPIKSTANKKSHRFLHILHIVMLKCLVKFCFLPCRPKSFSRLQWRKLKLEWDMAIWLWKLMFKCGMSVFPKFYSYPLKIDTPGSYMRLLRKFSVSETVSLYQSVFGIEKGSIGECFSSAWDESSSHV